MMLEITIDKHRIRRNVLASGAVFLAALALALFPDGFDRPLTEFINSFANRSALFDKLVAASSVHFTYTGVLLMALIWYCWFDTKDLETRARILVGTLASFGAGVVSRFSQHALSTHTRPFHDPTLNFHIPSGSEQPYNTWNSFPSDHVAVFAGLVVVIYIARSRFALLAIVWTAIIEISRAYVGAHYPSDLIGGAALAAIVVWISQASWPMSLGRRAVMWAQSSPALFYMGAFFFSYQIATLFADIRNTFGSLHIW